MKRHGWLSIIALELLCALSAGCPGRGPWSWSARPEATMSLQAAREPDPAERVDRSDPRTADLQAVADVPAVADLKTVAYRQPAPPPSAETSPPDNSSAAELPAGPSAPLPAPPATDPAPPDPPVVAAPPEPILAAPVLQLEDVVGSVRQSYPPLVQAQLERQIAAGRQLSAWGAFDLAVKAYGIAMPEGFYENYRHGFSVEQPVFAGGYLYSGYKIGDGDFQPWFGERETNEGGEFSAGFGVPLLKDRTIDKRREELFKSQLARRAVEPMVRTQLLEFVRMASQVYWTWVAAGQSVEAQRELLDLAEERVDQIEERVRAEDLPRIVLLNNEQLIAARETKLIESQRKLQESAIKLSLFLRGGDGQPRIPADSQLPVQFPRHLAPDLRRLEEDITRAVTVRPELVELRLLAEQVQVELAQAENMLLPKLDAQILAAKDVGGAASSKRDKTPFELEAGLYGEVPLQRREARGKIESARGKLSQIEAKRQFMVNKVTAQVQDSVSALDAAAGRIDRATTNLRLARETLELGRVQFEAGDIDLISLNIYEQAVTDARLLLIDAQVDYFIALADYTAALALE